MILDGAKNQTLQALHPVAERQSGGQQFTDSYFRRMDELLGFRSEQPTPPAAPRPAPVPQYGPPVSAPPTRESISMGNGRPVNYQPQLNNDEREIAWVSRRDPKMTQQQAEQEYMRNKVEYQRQLKTGQYRDER
jgi:hypothetical protein